MACLVLHRPPGAYSSYVLVGEALYSDWIVFLKRVARMSTPKDDDDHELKSHPTLSEERVAVIEELIQGGVWWVASGTNRVLAFLGRSPAGALCSV